MVVIDRWHGCLIKVQSEVPPWKKTYQNLDWLLPEWLESVKKMIFIVQCMLTLYRFSSKTLLYGTLWFKKYTRIITNEAEKMGANRSESVTKNSESSHNLGQYLCTNVWDHTKHINYCLKKYTTPLWFEVWRPIWRIQKHSFCKMVGPTVHLRCFPVRI